MSVFIVIPGEPAKKGMRVWNSKDPIPYGTCGACGCTIKLHPVHVIWEEGKQIVTVSANTPRALTLMFDGAGCECDRETRIQFKTMSKYKDEYSASYCGKGRVPRNWNLFVKEIAA